MYRRYKKHLYLWELVISFRKLGIVLGVLLFTSPILTALTALISIVVSLVLHIRYQPYLSVRVNRLGDSSDGFLLLLTCFVRELFDSYTSDNHTPSLPLPPVPT